MNALPNTAIETLFSHLPLESQKSLSQVSKRFNRLAYPKERLYLRYLIYYLGADVEGFSLASLVKQVRDLFLSAKLSRFSLVSPNDSYFNQSRIVQRFLEREILEAWTLRLNKMTDAKNFLSFPWGVKFVDGNFLILLKALISNPRIQTLEIAEGLKDFQAEALSIAMRKQSLKIQSLVIDADIILSPKAFHSILKGVSESESIKRFKITYLQTSTYCYQVLAKAIASAVSLESFTLIGSNSTKKMCDRLFSTLTRPSTLKELTLAHFNKDQLDALIQVFGKLQLEALFLSHGKLSTLQGDELIEGIKANSHLKKIDLSLVEMNDRLITLLKEACQESETLEEWYLPTKVHLIMNKTMRVRF